MHPSDLVQPLEDDWRDTLDAVARARGWPSSHEPSRLSAQVSRLSVAYNHASGDPKRLAAFKAMDAKFQKKKRSR